MSEAIDYNALNWVRQELGKVLRQAGSFLEKYSEDRDNTACLQDCARNLHLARGPLQMVGLRGADRVAAEMEEVIADLLQGTLARPDAALEALMQAFLQLPDYLSRLISRKWDNPAVLLPVINGLRAVRDVPVLEGSAVFSPDLSRPVPAEVFTPRLSVSDGEVRAKARAARLQFQAGLLEWYRGSEGNTGLQTLHGVLVQLLQDACLEAVARLWWAAAVVTEAMIAGDIAVTAENKQLFGRIDRQIKRFVDAGEAVFSDPLTDELMKRLLYRIAITDSSLRSIRLIKETYKLEMLLEESGDRAVADGSLAGCSDELLQTVAVTLSRDVERIQDRLDVFTRGDGGGPGSLLPVAEELHALGNILDMVGNEELGETVVGKARQIGDMAEGLRDIDASALAEVADLLVAVEAAVRNPGEGSTQSHGGGADDRYLEEGIQSVNREAAADLIRIKEAISVFTRSPDDSGDLSGVPGLLSRIRGSLQLSGQERAAVVAGRIGEFIAGELIGQHGSPDDKQFELLADAICGLEYYIEGSGGGHVQGERVLGVAEESLAALGYACPALLPEEEYDEVLRDDAPVRGEPGRPLGIEEVPREKPAESPALPVITGLQIVEADADGEILGIFVEEAGDVLSRLGEQLPAWLAATEDTELLKEAGRGFHTLKGSGRMVGALALGEFAWTFENLLNRVIDGTVEPGDELLDLLEHPVAALHQLLAQVRDPDAVPQADVDALARTAVLLSQPAAPPANSAKPAPQTDRSSLPVQADATDPDIFGAFLEEAELEIDAIAEAMPQWLSRQDDSGALGLLRDRLHNLKGSSRMTGVRSMGEFSGTVERLLDRLADGSLEPGEPVFELLRRIPSALQQLLRQLRDGVEPEADIGEIAALAGVLARSAMVVEETVTSGLAADRQFAPEKTPQAEPAFEETPQAEAVSEETSQAELLAEETLEAQGVPAETPAAEVDPGESADAESTPEDDPVLLEIFSRECSEHLQLIEAFLDSNRAPCAVTDALYRSLHTVASISCSAGVSSVSRLAAVLDEYFDGLYRGHFLAGREALELLRESTSEISRLIQCLPDMTYDEDTQQQLCDRIGSLPKSGAGQAVDDPYSSVDSELLDVFIEEASEIIDAGESTLRAWSEDPANQELMTEFQRQLHTLKGGARMVDITPIGDLSHTLESLLKKVVDGQVEVSSELFILLQDSHDHLAGMLEHVRARKLPADAGVLTTTINGMGLDQDNGGDAEPEGAPGGSEEVHTAGSGDGPGDAVTEEPTAAPVPEPAVAEAPTAAPEPEPEAMEGEAVEPEANPGIDTQPVEEAQARVEAPGVPDASPSQAPAEPATRHKTGRLPPKVERRRDSRVRSEQVRVRADLLDSMVNYAGELNIYRARMEQQISDYRYNLGELDQTIGRLREQLRQVEIETEAHILFRYEREGENPDREFDPLEMDRYSYLQQLSRSLNESINDLRSIQEFMGNTTRQSEMLLLQQSRVNTDLQESLLHSRMIPFAGIAPRLRRVLRQSARELDKKAELFLVGAEGEMDRTLIERIIAPLEHILRNAAAHGIESPEARREAGKSETGSVTISLARERSEIVLRIEDDGAGLDIEAIRARAIERKLLDEGVVLPDGDIMQFVLHTGFTTATKVTQISGRGVGMDVVNGEVKQLGGSLDISSAAGAGTMFTIRLPYTLAANQALLVRAGDETFCVPLGSVEGVARFSPGELHDCYRSEDNLLEYAGDAYQLKHLGSLLGCSGMEQGMPLERVPVLLVRSGERRVAFQLEAILGSREIVIKPLGPQFSKVEVISGATILGDGRVVLILDVMSISRLHGRPAVPDTTGSRGGDERLLVMVVDDSITVRNVTTRLLERNGFRVMTAKDGVDAMGQLQETVPDIMLLDIEMPRMDGFELATHMRNDERLKHVPVIMITSRTGDKHREHAKQIGVNGYLGKPYKENELLESIQGLIDIRKREEYA